MRLWDLLSLHSSGNDNVLYVLYMGGVKEVYPLDLIPYACLIEKVGMWEIDYDENEKNVIFRIWLGE